MNPLRPAALFAILIFLFPDLSSTASGLTPRERRGKEIYLLGTSPSGKKIVAVLEDSALDLPANVFPCVNCHGYDGKGKPEGGIVPSDITWDALTKSYGVKQPTGREHPPYTERSLGLAVLAGRDPAGNKLLGAMPRYRMSREDLRDLVAYLARVGKDRDPGITETSIRIGMLDPSRGPMADVGAAIQGVMSAYFEDVNSRGGIYNRKIDLRVAEWAGANPEEAVSGARHLIDDEQVFALGGAFIAGADEQLAAYFGEREVPVIGPFTLKPQVQFPLNRYVFYLFSGIDAQSRVLMNFLNQRLLYEKPRVVLLYPESDLVRETARAIAEREAASERQPVTKVSYPSERFDAPRLCRELSNSGTDVVLFLGSGREAAILMAEAAQLHWSPTLLLPGSLVSKEIFDAPVVFKNKIWAAFPTLPSDQTERGVMEFTEFAKRHKLPEAHIAAQVAAYCSAKVLAEGLKLAGREVSREKLIVALEGLYDFDTGLAPKISYGPNRRIGAWGAYVIAIDPDKKAFGPKSDWMPLQ